MKLIDLIRPYDIKGPLKRFGNIQDGGYVLNYKFLKLTERLYSYGFGNDFSFEKDIVNCINNYHVYIYDHTVDNIKDIYPKITFYKNGLFSSKTENCDTFMNHVDQNNDNNKKIILKIDIESNEIDFFSKINMKNLKNVVQMVVEFHMVYLDENAIYLQSFNKDLILENMKIIGNLYKKTLDILDKINQYFYCIHLHPNNFSPTVNIEGIEYPMIFECTFINKEYIDYEPKLIYNKTYPILNLDYENSISNKQICVNF